MSREPTQARTGPRKSRRRPAPHPTRTHRTRGEAARARRNCASAEQWPPQIRPGSSRAAGVGRSATQGLLGQPGLKTWGGAAGHGRPRTRPHRTGLPQRGAAVPPHGRGHAVRNRHTRAPTRPKRSRGTGSGSAPGEQHGADTGAGRHHFYSGLGGAGATGLLQIGTPDPRADNRNHPEQPRRVKYKLLFRIKADASAPRVGPRERTADPEERVRSSTTRAPRRAGGPRGGGGAATRRRPRTPARTCRP